MKTSPPYKVRPISDLREMLSGSAAVFGDRPAFLRKKAPFADYEPVSYRRFQSDVDALGTALLEMGQQGRRIAVIGENQYGWVTTYLAVVNGVGVIVPIDRELPEEEIVRCLTRAGVSSVVFAESKRDVFRSIAAKLDFIEHYIDMGLTADQAGFRSLNQLIALGHESMRRGGRRYLETVIDPQAVSVLLFTSATTSEAKVVPLSHRNLCENMMATTSVVHFGPEDVLLSILPIHHTYENMCGFLGPLYRGCAVAFCDGLRHIPRNLKESGCSVLITVPLVLETVYKRIWSEAEKSGKAARLRRALGISNALRRMGIDLRRRLFRPVLENLSPRLRLLVCGAAALSPQVSKGFDDLGIVTLQGYGLTECSPIVACNRDRAFKHDAAGLPVPGLDVRLRDIDAEGMGEIVVRGPSVMSGYFEQPAETAKAFTADGFFRTGDLGFIDEDGFVHVTGRSKNVIVTKNGKNVYPEEIEARIGLSPYVLECMVYGQTDGQRNGDVEIVVSIVPAMESIAQTLGTQAPGTEDVRRMLQDVVRGVNQALPAYKRIHRIVVRETEFIKTTTKKIKRYLEKSV